MKCERGPAPGAGFLMALDDEEKLTLAGTVNERKAHGSRF